MKPFGSTSFRELCSLFISLWDERNKKENKNNTSFTNINSLYLIFVFLISIEEKLLSNFFRTVWEIDPV